MYLLMNISTFLCFNTNVIFYFLIFDIHTLFMFNHNLFFTVSCVQKNTQLTCLKIIIQLKKIFLLSYVKKGKLKISAL